ncbi:hypothetical protein [Pseudoalteromonas lipolytica]|uniref:Lipoprotein n=1 Tax=Pseudoalteromonas lipolytica TaxID=570156 RepID=A0ABU8SYP7_9GAMM
MKTLYLIALTSLITGCVSFKPVEIESIQKFSDTSDCGDPVTDICKARLYASSISQKYKSTVLDNYGKNNEFDSWILNLVTIGVGAEVADLHSDVVKSAAVGLGYQSARKTYRSIPFQMQIYTNAITAAQCVYDNSRRLEDGFSKLDKIQLIISALDQSISILDVDTSLTNQLINNHFKELGSYDLIKTKLTRALDLANQSFNSLDSADVEVVQAIQRIDITILKRFNGQLPDISEISSQIRAQITENIKLDEGGDVSELPSWNVQNLVLAGATPPPYAHLKKPLADALLAMNELSKMRVERYISDLNLVKACSARI